MSAGRAPPVPECGAPPQKKPRTESEDGRAPNLNFLNTLPKEVLDNVLRYFSCLPEAEYWVPHIPLESVVELYGVGTFMESCLKVNTLCVSKSFKCAYEHELFKWEKRQGTMLWTKDLQVARRFVLAGGGQHLHTIIIGLGMYRGNGKGGADISMVDDFHKSCPHVTSLSIEDKKGVWVSRFGGQISRLEIVTQTSSTISKTCHNLRELNLTLESYYIEGTDLWETVGWRLESLTLNFGDLRLEEIEFGVAVAVGEIKMQCRNLRRISIYKMKYLNDKIADLLASYGDKLEYCHVEDMDESALSNITSACANARFSAKVTLNSEIYPTLQVLGRQLEKIRVVFHGDLPDFDDLTNAWNGCMNTRDLEVWNCSIEHAKAIMATAKDRVTRLYINPRCTLEEDEVKDMIDIFSQGTAAVERFTYRGPRLPADAFDALIEKNKPSLRALSLLFGGGIKKMDTFLPPFLKCTALEDVYGNRCIWNENTLKTLQRRGVTCHDNSGYPFCARSSTGDTWLL